MKMFTTALAVVGALAIGLVSNQALACGGHYDKGKGHGMIKKMIRSANLSPEQRTKVKAMRQEFSAKHQALGKRQKGAFFRGLASAIESGDESELEELFAAKQKAHAARQNLKMMKIKRMLSLLTDEQRVRVAAKMRQGKKQHRKNHRKHKGGDYH
jgi:Spy/CpxP family protein refolding chaperone